MNRVALSIAASLSVACASFAGTWILAKAGDTTNWTRYEGRYESKKKKA